MNTKKFLVIFMTVVIGLGFTQSKAQSVADGNAGRYTRLHDRTRCIECKFYGCIELVQQVDWDHQENTIVRGPVDIRVYNFPCACNTGPVIPSFIGHINGSSAFPWNRLHEVVAPPGNGTFRTFHRPINPNNETLIELSRILRGNWTDDELFGLPSEFFTRLIDPTWPNSYINSAGQVIKQPFPILPCGTAKTNQFNGHANTEKLNQMINKLKEMVAQGKSSDQIQNWINSVEKEMTKLKNGQAVTIPGQGLIDLGRGIDHTFFGGCFKSEAHWWENNRKLKMQAVFPMQPCNITSNTPIDFYDPNIWQQSFPISHVTIMNLINGHVYHNESYNMQRDIEVDVEHIPNGTFIGVVIHLFDGRKFIQKMTK